MYITINNEKYELTSYNINEINRQEAIEMAQDAIACGIDCEYVKLEDVENFTEWELEEIGQRILDKVFYNAGDIAYSMLEQYGLIKED